MFEWEYPITISNKEWLKPHEEAIGIRIGHFYTPKQMKIIFEKIGIPELMEMP